MEKKKNKNAAVFIKDQNYFKKKTTLESDFFLI